MYRIPMPTFLCRRTALALLALPLACSTSTPAPTSAERPQDASRSRALPIAQRTAPKAIFRGDPALRKAVNADYTKNLAALFKHFHAHPELSFKETKTAKRLASELRSLGYNVEEGVGGTGVVAVMKNGPGPTVMLRADMDGLPIEETSGLAYASKVRQTDIDGVEKPVMHACGHDVHITALVGTARQLAARRNEWKGTLVLIGQPAEERIGGAKAMLEDGLYQRFPKPDYALAFHVAAALPAGRILVRRRLVSSSSDSVNITVRGVGAHGAGPHKGVDPILVASHIVVGLQSIVSRNINPLAPGVITVGSIHGGFKHNIIPNKVELQLTVRSNDTAIREQLLAGIKRTSEGIARGLGVPNDLLPVVEYGFESTPTTVNDEATADRIRTAFAEAFGESRLIDVPPEGMGAEDFAYFVQPELNVKGVYFAVGGTPEGQTASAAGHHSPQFKISPEPSVKTGVLAMTVGAMTLLKGGARRASLR